MCRWNGQYRSEAALLTETPHRKNRFNPTAMENRSSDFVPVQGSETQGHGRDAGMREPVRLPPNDHK
jgi:hypothetical protein